MKTKFTIQNDLHRCLARMLVLVFGATLALPVPAQDSGFDIRERSLATLDTEMRVEVLSLTVSKLGRDNLGNAVSPFSDFGFSKEHSGTVLLAKITPAASPVLKLLRDRCRLISFKDDAGTDLSTNAASGLGDSFFAGNRPLEILTARDPDSFGVRVRSARLPARAATRLTAEVLLTFAPTSGEKSDMKEDVALQLDQVTSVGPLKIKFWAGPTNHYQPTNSPAVAPQPVRWMASFVSDPDVTIASVAFFSAKSDEPILLLKDLAGGGHAASFQGATYTMGAQPGESKDEFSRRVRYMFIPPEDGKATIKIRYNATSALVEKRCVISTGLSP